jgi:hypothetical protein
MDSSQENNLRKKIEGKKIKERARTLIWESYRSQDGGQR